MTSVSTRAAKRVREAEEDLARREGQNPQVEVGSLKHQLSQLSLEGQVQRLWEALEDTDEENHALAAEVATSRKLRFIKQRAFAATVRQLQTSVEELRAAREEANQLRELLQLAKNRQARMEGSLTATYREATDTLQRMNVDKATGRYTFATE
jgi:chromosome segregation ATPase